MKIIDLLNKIANKEEIPKKFKVNNHTWEWNVHSYQNELSGEFAVTGFRYDLSNLNDEIEIIEESQDHKIPEKLKICVNIYDEIMINNEVYSERQVREVADKINEILDYLEEIE